MKRNVLLVVALAAAVAFTVLVHNANGGTAGGNGSAAGDPGMTLPGQPRQGQPGAGGVGNPNGGNPGGGAPTGQASTQQTGRQTGQHGTAGVDPDSFFTPTKLKPGEKPPQFVVISFDGAGSHQKWEYWKGVAQQSNMRFTAFLSGVYLVSAQHKTAYHGPGHNPGASSIGFSTDRDSVRQEVLDLNDAWRRGYEIGTHYNGHFCSGAGYAVADRKS